MHLFKIRSKIKIGIYAFSLFNFWHFAKQKRRQKEENLMEVAFGKKNLANNNYNNKTQNESLTLTIMKRKKSYIYQVLLVVILKRNSN